MISIQPIIIENAPAKVKVRLDSESIIFPMKTRNQQQLYWDIQIKKNPSLRNGEVFTITDIIQTSDELEVTVAKTDYKHYLYTLNHADCTNPCKVIYVCASVITSDQHIAIGRMNKTTSTPGRLQFTGGGLDESDLVGSIFDLEKSMTKEMREEMGLNIHSLSTYSFLPKFIKHKGTHDFWAVMYELLVDYKAKELYTLFQNHNQQIIKNGLHPEFEDLLFVPLERAAIEAFIQNEQTPMVDYLAPILEKYAES